MMPTFLALFALMGAAQADTPEWMVPGTELVYDVDAQGNQYEFHVVLEQATEGLSFSWRMTEPVGTQGWVDIRPEALKIARAQVNHFAGGEVSLEEATTVWLSRVVYDDLKEKQRAKVIHKGEEVELVVEESAPFPTTIMGEELAPVPVHAATEDGAHAYWILDDPDSPLILKMDHGWTISLRYITSGLTRAEQEAETRRQFLETLTKVPDEPPSKLCIKAVKEARKQDPLTYVRTSGAGEPMGTVVLAPQPEAKKTDKGVLLRQFTLTGVDGSSHTGAEELRCVGDTLWLHTTFDNVDGSPITLDPPMPVLPLDLDGARAWNYQGVWTFGDEEALVKVDFTVGNPMDITVAAGSFQALPVKYDLDLGDGVITYREWVLPGKANALLRQEDELSVMELQE